MIMYLTWFNIRLELYQYQLYEPSVHNQQWSYDKKTERDEIEQLRKELVRNFEVETLF